MKNSEKATVLLRDIAEIFSKKEFAETCAKTFISAKEIPSFSWSLGNQILMLFSETVDACNGVLECENESGKTCYENLGRGLEDKK